MKISASGILILIESILLILGLYPELHISLAVILFFVSLGRLVLKIGNGSFFLELVYVYAAFTCLLMPVLGYVYFNRTSSIAAIWVRSMPIPAEQYFSFNLPAVISLGWGFFLFRKNSPDNGPVISYLTTELKKDILKVKPGSILGLTIISLVAYSISNFLPASLQQLNSFLYYSLFAGVFYIIFYKNFPGKIYFIAGFISFIVLDALRYGMFTIIAYMGGLFLILLLAGKRIYFYHKIGLIVFSILLISFIQLFKVDLRRSRKMHQDVSITELATNVVGKRQQSSFDEILFPLYFRMNQGFNIALVQRRIPSKVDYLNGEYLGLCFISSFVPRLFWADKPKAGGEENMRIYTGYVIKTWSTNVGPIGEAYGNFGYWGGWIYLFAFAFFIRAVYTKFLSICHKRPIFFLWMPAMFFQTFYVIETDSLQAFNSLIKGAVFLFILYKIFPAIFPDKSQTMPSTQYVF